MSNWQGTIDWGPVRDSGQLFVFVQANDGSNQNDLFSDQFNGAREAGLYAGAYTYGRFDSSATDQANLMLDMAGYGTGLGLLPPVIDLENQSDTDACGGFDAATITAWVHEYSDTVAARIGAHPLIYTRGSWWSQCMADTTEFAGDHLLWTAEWEVDEPTMYGGWATYTFWQQTDSGSVDGIGGPVDLDVFNGTVEALAPLAVY